MNSRDLWRAAPAGLYAALSKAPTPARVARIVIPLQARTSPAVGVHLRSAARDTYKHFTRPGLPDGPPMA